MTQSDAVFKIKDGGKMFGTLTVSRGSVVWFPSGTSYGYKVGWSKFAKMMEERATRFEKR